MKRFGLLVLAAALLAPAALAAPEAACPACKRPAAAGDWKFCPFDGAALVVPEVVPAPPPPPAPAPAPAPEPPPAPAPVERPADAAPGNPLDTVDALFRAISAGDAAWIKKLYRWDQFFAGEPADKLGARIDDYIQRLISKVKPALAAGNERYPADIKLTRETAELKVALRDPATRKVSATYEFSLKNGNDGWKIVAIR